MANKTIDEVITCMFSDVKKYVTQMVQNVQLNGTAAVPSGTIIHGMWAVAPEGYLLCDGTEYSVNDYYNLYNVLADIDATTRATWGNADWTTTFNVPDLRGEFLRMAGTNVRENQGSGANVGVHQDATRHPYSFMATNDVQISANTNIPDGGRPYETDYMYSSNKARWAGTTSGNTVVANYGDYTSRPTNTSVNYAIRI